MTVRWSKRGLVLPAPLPVSWARSHAALPVVVPLSDGRVRVYFSSRDADGRSLIGRAELDLERPAETLSLHTEPVLGLGPLGAFDDSGVTTSCLVEDAGHQYLYYSGWSRGATVPFTLFVGCAVSEDGGETFERVSLAPILERNAIDPFLTASPWVLVDEGRWRMWYVSGTEWRIVAGTPRHRYHIKYAESRDGVTWERDGTVCIDFRDDTEYAISRPCVVRDGDRYRMWFAARGDAYRIGCAESLDGVRWERRDAEAGIEPSESGWDSEMQAYPVVFDHAGERYLLYNGNGYGLTGIGCAVLVGERPPTGRDPDRRSSSKGIRGVSEGIAR